MKNIFTVDLEDWYHANYDNINIKNPTSTVIKPTLKILKLLKHTNNTATFFAVGKIVEKHPDLIKEIQKQGHEIASHSYDHQLIYKKTQVQFETDLEKSINIIKKTIGKPPIGYRAPSWSVTKQNTPWFWKILKKHGIKYSSSLFPFKTYLYGDNQANRFQHKIDNIVEIPPSVIQIGKQKIPFSGGFYLRLVPYQFIKIATNKINKQSQTVVFYIHPREIDINQPKIKLNPTQHFIHYYNIKNTYNKLKKVLNTYQTTSFKNYLSL